MVTEMKKTEQNTITYSDVNVGDCSYNVYNEDHSQNKGNGFFMDGDKNMNELKPVGIIEKVFGHKGAVLVKPLVDTLDELKSIKN